MIQSYGAGAPKLGIFPGAGVQNKNQEPELSLKFRTGITCNFWLAKFLTSHHARMHRVIFYILNTLMKLII